VSRIRFVATAALLIAAPSSSAALADSIQREAPADPQEYWEAIQNPPLCARNELALKAIELNLQHLRNTPGRKLMIETKNTLLCAMEDGDVKTLERLTDEYAKDRTLNFGGTWKTKRFLEAISNFLSHGNRDKQLALWRALYKKWITAYPKSLTAPIAHASALRDEAWSYRGGGYVNSIREDAWNPFLKNMKAAQKVLEGSKATTSSNPRWYSELIFNYGTMGASRTKLLTLAREGLKKFPGNKAIIAETMNMLTPKWGGDVDAMESWAREAVEASKAVSGISAYADAYENVMLNVSKDEILGYKVDWAYYSQSADDLQKYYPSMETVDESVRMSCNSHDPVVVTRRLSQADRIYLPATNWTIMPWSRNRPEVVCNWKKDDVKIPSTGVISPESLFLKQQRKSDGWQ
jgi:hypothetical protein